MDDERKIREFLEGMASEIPAQARPPARFRSRVRRRMALTGGLAAASVAALIVSGIAVINVARSAPPPGVATPASAPKAMQLLTGDGLIAFVSDRSGNDDIWVVNPDGTGLHDLTSDPAQEETPAWSPDGSKIAFSRETGGSRDIWVMDADGSHQVALTSGPANESDPSWSPDGLQIAYTRSEVGGNGSVWLMNADGTQQHELLGERLGDLHPTWSPDGTEIAFFGYGTRISVIRPDGTGLRHLTDGAQDINPSWCLSGEPIVFNRVGRPQGGVAPVDIYTVRSDGSGLSRLTTDGVSSNPSCSPSGGRITFSRLADASTSGANGDIYVISVDGSRVTQITNGPANDGWTSWQPVP